MRKFAIFFFSSIIFSTQLYAAPAKAKKSAATQEKHRSSTSHMERRRDALTLPSSDAPAAIAQRYFRRSPPNTACRQPTLQACTW